ncbi:alpha/beta fold hydrolase [Hamadaea tsunoensis]|uniref:alpha/beta fold hydrolase n=1 Tax=Hamadaea tsunoensis TaxID=53368 RepID=UPI0003FE5FB3|nr:alpha/beta hydrolase [Hamadaea tsunoensis]
MSTIQKVISRDGTPIAYASVGTGTPVIFVVGALNDRHKCVPVAESLADGFTAVTYDRRARGASGDTRPYAVQREVEDLTAVIEAVGGPAAVFGFSSGANLVLHAAAAGAPISEVVLFEPPFTFGVPAPDPDDLPERLQALLDAGKPDEVVTTFQIDGIGMPAEVVEQMRHAPFFAGLAAMTQSVVYDAVVARELRLPTPEMLAVKVPVLILNGAETWPRLRDWATELANRLPGATREEVSGGENHGIPTESTAEAIRAFLKR